MRASMLFLVCIILNFFGDNTYWVSLMRLSVQDGYCLGLVSYTFILLELIIHFLIQIDNHIIEPAPSLINVMRPVKLIEYKTKRKRQ